MPKTCAEAIQASLTKLERREAEDRTGWTTRHLASWRYAESGRRVAQSRPQNFEGALVRGIEAAALYADAHRARFDSPIGDDGVLGPCFRDWLTGLRGLLNGETGRLDCGTVDGLILEIAAIAGLEDFE